MLDEEREGHSTARAAVISRPRSSHIQGPSPDHLNIEAILTAGNERHPFSTRTASRDSREYIDLLSICLGETFSLPQDAEPESRVQLAGLQTQSFKPKSRITSSKHLRPSGSNPNLFRDRFLVDSELADMVWIDSSSTIHSGSTTPWIASGTPDSDSPYASMTSCSVGNGLQASVLD